MPDTVTADGKGFDQDSGRVGNADAPAGRTTAIEEQPIDTKSAPPTLLQGLSEEELRAPGAYAADPQALFDTRGLFHLVDPADTRVPFQPAAVFPGHAADGGHPHRLTRWRTMLQMLAQALQVAPAQPASGTEHSFDT